jgi:predicted transcriptional regulator
MQTLVYLESGRPNLSLAQTNETKQKTEVTREGIIEKDGVLIVSGEEYIYRVCSALASPTRIKILMELLRREADVGEIADMIKQSKANASTQVRRLEEIGLVRSEYRPGVRGVRKVVKTAVKEIRIILEPPKEEKK